MLNRKDFILNERIFDFDKYPELEKLYKEYTKLSKKLLKSSMGKGDGVDYYELVRNMEKGEFSRLIFNTFHGKVKNVYHEFDGIKTWEEVFGDDYDLLDDMKKRCLVLLLDGNFVYRLPDEYYVVSAFPQRG